MLTFRHSLAEPFIPNRNGKAYRMKISNSVADFSIGFCAVVVLTWCGMSLAFGQPNLGSLQGGLTCDPCSCKAGSAVEYECAHFPHPDHQNDPDRNNRDTLCSDTQCIESHMFWEGCDEKINGGTCRTYPAADEACIIQILNAGKGPDCPHQTNYSVPPEKKDTDCSPFGYAARCKTVSCPDDLIQVNPQMGKITCYGTSKQ